MPSETEKAYIAGILDGEGYITLRRSRTKTGNPSYRIVIGVTNTEICLLEWIRNIYGGMIYPKSRKSIKHSQAWEWSIHNKETCLVILNDIRIYSRIKLGQIKLAIDFINLRKMRKEGSWPIFRVIPEEIQLREKFKEELSFMNHRGLNYAS